jgi:hypothetical protein
MSYMSGREMEEYTHTDVYQTLVCIIFSMFIRLFYMTGSSLDPLHSSRSLCVFL